jgi:hypothetical protein
MVDRVYPNHGHNNTGRIPVTASEFPCGLIFIHLPEKSCGLALSIRPDHLSRRADRL